MEKELAKLREENKKISRQLAVTQNMIDRIKLSSKVSSALSTIIASEKFNQDIFFNLVLKNSPNIILILDESGRFLYCTDSFLKKAGIANFGLISGRAFPKVFKGFLTVSEIEHFSSVIAKAMLEKRNVTLDIAIDFSRKNDPRSYSINLTPMDNSNGDTIGVMALFHDMTDFLNAQQSEAASRAKSIFLATMSHEIRTPLNAIIGLSEVELQNDLSASTRKNLETIYTSGSNLLCIVDDVLDISKIESGELSLSQHKYDVPSLINDVVQLSVVRLGSRKKLSFNLLIDETIPVSLYGDDLLVKRILNNLLSNAFKYTERGSITFRVEWEQRKNDAWLTFMVTDTGKGIKKHDLKKIFRDHSQLDTRTTRSIEGTGLGLAITKKLVELMDGTVSVQSEFEKGSTFTAKIRQTIMNVTPIGKDIAENLKNFQFMGDYSRIKNLVRAYMPYGKVLVTDDVPINLDVAKGLMLPYGLTIDFANSGKEAIEKIREEKILYDVVFMDHMMPEMDGIEATRVIRHEIGTEYARTVPIVALTANATAGNRAMFLSSGFNDFLSKPIDIMRLDVVLNQWIRAKQSEETLLLAERIKAQMSKSSITSQVLEKLSVKGVDLSAGIERYSDEAVYLGVLRSFVKHTPELLSSLRKLREENLAEYAIIVHGIKGSAYGICAHEVGSRAEALERSAKVGDFQTVRTDNEAFLALTETLLDDLTKFLMLVEEASKSDAPKRSRPAPNKELLQKLLEAAVHFKTSQMEEVMNELELYEYTSGGELITWLKEQIDHLEYGKVCERLEKHLKEVVS